ncbi:MAG: DsbA family oxidoreductase [Burkholderiaceae bacterium]|jgi:predicted DsbA family dithiol-disulfide isomerase|nr:DsbA family oxidoreductase [Burkholderiaceae bacterium]MDP4969002.1 DsbA family oxidoreductase [Burkholderiaceae bacterium]MDP5111124.1 DsbA family oxidoreductase [Burkholderiaceae bacterium]
MIIKIDYVSDIACPWCAVGLGGLEIAIKNLGETIPVEIHFQPFELNPQMPPGGQEVFEHLTQKYGKTVAQVRATQEDIKARAAAVGYPFHPEGRKHVYNTFDAHRLLYWAGLEHGPAAQHRLKRELLVTYFTLAVNLDDQSNLIAAVERAGLDTARADQILKSEEFQNEVRAQENKYTSLGIHSVPAIIINDQYLLQGAQPPEAFEQALRQIAAESTEKI